MFKLTQSPTFWAKVEVEVTGEDGRRVSVVFDLQYKRISQDEAEVLATRMAGEDESIRGIVRDLVTGWREVAGDDGSTLDWSPAAFETMLNLGFGKAIFDTFLRNLPKAKVKN